MANESVSPERVSSEPKGCPDVRDLLMNVSDIDHETDTKQLERYRYGADCTFNTVIDGIEAIAHLLWHTQAYSKEPIDDQLPATCWLIKELAMIARYTDEIKSEAAYQLYKIEFAEAKGGRS